MLGKEYKEYLDRISDVCIKAGIDDSQVLGEFAKFVFRETSINFDMHSLSSEQVGLLDKKLEQISKAIEKSLDDACDFKESYKEIVMDEDLER